jgi:hypothetical protein
LCLIWVLQLTNNSVRFLIYQNWVKYFHFGIRAMDHLALL